VLDNPWYGEQNIFFAMVGNEPVGFVNAGIDVGLNREKNLKYGWILDVGVLKPYRRKGIGARLMVHAMQVLKGRKMTEALLYVDETNPTKATKLYEKVGFKVAMKSIIYELALA
jgi:ribosomal protein S18 acetylase RimI-like enzyme